MKNRLLFFCAFNGFAFFCHAQADYIGFVNSFYSRMFKLHKEKGIRNISVGGNMYALKDLCFDKSIEDFFSMIKSMETYSYGYNLSSILELEFKDGSSLYYELWSDQVGENENTYDYEILEIYDTEGESLVNKGEYLICGAGINDPDGYVNVRSEKSAKSKVVTQITKDQIFFYTPTSKSNWWRVYLIDGGKPVGYVYKDKILPYRKCSTDIKEKIEYEMNCEAD